MLGKSEIKQITKDTIITSIGNYARNSLNRTAKFQILDLIIPEERKIRSIVGGLEGALGTTLWEPLARGLAAGNGFEVVREDLLCPVNMPSNLNNTLQSITDDRKSEGGQYDAQSSHDSIKAACQRFIASPIDSFTKPKSGRGVDVWLRKNGTNYFFDTKTVQPNLSTLIGCLDQILGWYAFFYAKNPQGSAEGRIVFPYNPTPDRSFWDGVMGGGKPLEPDSEAWVGDQFWDFCSGYTGTYSVIEESFTEIRESGDLQDVLAELLSR